MSYVLGINCSGFHSAACLLEAGRIRAAVCEERLTRVKQDNSFPHKAIQYCCDAAGVPFSEVSHAFIGWHPRFYVGQSDRTLLDAMRSRGKIAYLALNELARIAGAPVADVTETFETADARLAIRFVDHHEAHLANAFHQSGLAHADFLVLDGFGEITTGMCGSVSASGADVAATYPSPHSLGSFYSAFTDFLGFRPDSDEWKVMALSALGDSGEYYDRIRPLVRVKGLAFELDPSYFEHFLFYKPRQYSEKLAGLLGAPLAPGQEPSEREACIVAAVQRVAEETVFEILRTLQLQTGNTDLVLGGGFFMNSVCNGKIHEQTPYGHVFIGGSPDDSGIGIGSALYGSRTVLGEPGPVEAAQHNYFGRPYSSDEVRQELARRKIRFETLEDAPATAARLVHDEKIVGWFQGGSEFGQRALGNRSILAHPGPPDMKDKVNASVKYREGFRPFAPSVLKERQGAVLEIPDADNAYFMEKVYRFREAWKARVPAVVHGGGTGRLQTVDKAVNPMYYRLVKEFEQLSGLPLVLNTSFNVNGMPLVESPGDAIACFYSCGLDALIIEDCLVEK